MAVEVGLIGHEHPVLGKSFVLIWTCWVSGCFHQPTVVYV